MERQAPSQHHRKSAVNHTFNPTRPYFVVSASTPPPQMTLWYGQCARWHTVLQYTGTLHLLHRLLAEVPQTLQMPEDKHTPHTPNQSSTTRIGGDGGVMAP